VCSERVKVAGFCISFLLVGRHVGGRDVANQPPPQTHGLQPAGRAHPGATGRRPLHPIPTLSTRCTHAGGSGAASQTPLVRPFPHHRGELVVARRPAAVPAAAVSAGPPLVTVTTPTAAATAATSSCGLSPLQEPQAPGHRRFHAPPLIRLSRNGGGGGDARQ